MRISPVWFPENPLPALSICIVAACGGASERPSEFAEPVEASQVETMQPPIAAEPRGGNGELPNEPAPDAPPAVLLSVTADFMDDAGDELIQLLADGTLLVGELRAQVELEDEDSYFMDQQAAISVEMFDSSSGLRVIHVQVPTADQEDPPNQHQLFVLRDGALHRVLNAVIGAYGVVPIEFPGDGTVRYQEDGWTACERAGLPEQARRDMIALSMGAHGNLSDVQRTRTGDVQVCHVLAACPFVYRVRDGQAELMGEILRDVRGRASYTRQTLAVGDAERTVHIRLAEEKLEITYLDEVYLEVGGVTVYPRACSGDDQALYCQRDHSPLTLRPGDTLDLWFDLPEGTAGEATLVATGYYLPTPTLLTR